LTALEFVFLSFKILEVRYFLEIAYNGQNYNGWQRQPDAPSVQESIEYAIKMLFGVEVLITGAGRTDTGVHAKQLFAHFDFGEINDLSHLQFRLNSFLSKDIAIRDIFIVKDDAHARFDAIEREYEYHITFKKNPFEPDLAFHTTKIPNMGLMNEAARILFDYNDFQCFSRTKTDVKTYHCSIKKAEWMALDDKMVFTITADRFLRNMVRAIVGTLLEIGYGKMPVSWMHDVIQSKTRSNAGASAPAHGLFLTKVIYPESIRLNA